MKFSNYISHVIEPDRIESPFQFRFSSEVEKLKGDIEQNLKYFYYNTLYDNNFSSTYCEEFLAFHYQRFTGEKDDFIEFVTFTLDDIPNLKFPLSFEDCKVFDYEPGNSRELEIKAWVQRMRVGVKKGLPSIVEQIKWKESPALFGYLFLELVKKGYLEPPLRNGESNFTALARLCYSYFEIESAKGRRTTFANLQKELSETKNSLSETKRQKFTIPWSSELT